MKKLLTLLTTFALFFSAATAFASGGPAGYPKGPIQLIVTYTAGAATDFQARIVSMMAGQDKYFGQPIVIINRAGAGGMTGWNWVAERASTDGMMMTTYNLPHLIAQAIVQKPKFTPDSFIPLANWGSDPAVLVVTHNSQFKTLKDLVDFAKANPKRLTVNGAGLYVGHHVATLQLQRAAGIEVTYVPEQGAADAIASLYSGTVMATFTNLSDAFRAQDRMHILGIADVQRHAYLPDVATFQEQGINVDNASVNFRGFAFPVGVPEEIVEYAAQVSLAMFNDPQVVAKMEESGSPMHVLDRAGAKALFDAQVAALTALFGN